MKYHPSFLFSCTLKRHAFIYTEDYYYADGKCVQKVLFAQFYKPYIYSRCISK